MNKIVEEDLQSDLGRVLLLNGLGMFMSESLSDKNRHKWGLCEFNGDAVKITLKKESR